MLFHRVVAELTLITLTLWLQSAGVAALVAWLRRTVKDEIHAMNAFRLAALFVRLAIAVVVLHGLEILVRAAFYRWHCFERRRFSCAKTTNDWTSRTPYKCRDNIGDSLPRPRRALQKN
jgi:hypothetical protein